MIILNSISKKYPGSKNYALKDISFAVNKGEVLGLIGENGAGKTTIHLILSTLIKPSSGAAVVMGTDLNKNPGFVRRHIGVHLTDQRLYERLTGKENIAYFAKLHGCDNNYIIKKIRDLSGLFGMNDYIEDRVSTYSQGMKQKISLARILAHDPSILLLDEPGAGLDLSSLYILLDFIKKCREDNKTVLFSSHNLPDLSGISDRIIILHKGRVMDQGSMEELCGKHECDLENLYLKIIREKSP